MIGRKGHTAVARGGGGSPCTPHFFTSKIKTDMYKDITQKAVINIVIQRIFLWNLSFRMSTYIFKSDRYNVLKMYVD